MEGHLLWEQERGSSILSYPTPERIGERRAPDGLQNPRRGFDSFHRCSSTSSSSGESAALIRRRQEVQDFPRGPGPHRILVIRRLLKPANGVRSSVGLHASSVSSAAERLSYKQLRGCSSPSPSTRIIRGPDPQVGKSADPHFPIAQWIERPATNRKVGSSILSGEA